MPVFLVSTPCCAPGSSAFALAAARRADPGYNEQRRFFVSTTLGDSPEIFGMKIGIQSLGIVILTFVGFALSDRAKALVPPPDGGYPNFNTAEGQNALFSLTTGVANTAVGWFSLKSNVDASFNTGVGAGALLFNTADENTAVGAAVLLFNTTGSGNTAVGSTALFNNNIGNFNTATGSDALRQNTTGGTNVANGFAALNQNTTGSQNTATGPRALVANTEGFNNTAVGHLALGGNTSGVANTAVGVNAGVNVTTANNVICIGAGVGGINVDDSCFIGNIRGALVAPDAAPVLIDSAGKLGTTNGSSRRFKNKIKRMEKASEAIMALKPVTFQYNSDKTNTPQFGLIAEEVADVDPDLVVRDKDGEVYTVRYDAVNAMLLNEFLKEHRKVEELKSAMAQQRKDFETAIVQQGKATEALVARLNEQEARIQKVSAQVEARKSGSQMLVENQ
jgi:hypothetical protein